MVVDPSLVLCDALAGMRKLRDRILFGDRDRGAE